MPSLGTIIVAASLALLAACIGSQPHRHLYEPDGGGGTAAVGTSTDPATDEAGGGDAPMTGSGSTTSAAGGASTGTEEQPSCPDTSAEPNDTQGDATDLGSADDCDENGGYLSGVLGGGDVDWYAYAGADTFGCLVNPGRDFDATGPVRVCAFIACPGLWLDCPDGTTLDLSPFGFPGCCSDTSFELWPECDSWNDEAKVYIRVDQPEGQGCVDYDLAYHF
jgi:hypothetical protein